jgi:hypothetical protein
MIRIALAFIVLLTTAKTASAAYCAMYSNGTRACGIPTLQMCVQTVSGVGGTCQEDFTDLIPPNFAQRLRAPSPSSVPPPSDFRPSRGRSPSTVSSPRPLTTSPCMSLSGDSCSNYLH